MPSNDPPPPNYLTQIDASNIDDHPRLTADDVCYFWREYTSHRDYTFSATNQLISNLKKKPSRPEAQLKYKRRDIARCAGFFAGAINQEWLAQATLVPVPCSKARNHPDYDDRMTQVCRAIPANLDIRELVIQTTSTNAAHEGLDRPSVEDLLAVYAINEAIADPPPTKIAIFDDVLTAGTHFRAMEIVLHRRFGPIPIVGFFVARRIFPDDDFGADFDEI
jgi:predicted amidophosphoribosyltransferase